MKRVTFSCGDRIYIKIKTHSQNGLICESVDTIDEKVKVRVVMENGKVAEMAVGKITKR